MTGAWFELMTFSLMNHCITTRVVSGTVSIILRGHVRTMGWVFFVKMDKNLVLLPHCKPPPLSLSRTEIISRMHDIVLYLQNNITHPILDVRGSNTKGGNEDFLQHHCDLVQLFGEKCRH